MTDTEQRNVNELGWIQTKVSRSDTPATVPPRSMISRAVLSVNAFQNTLYKLNQNLKLKDKLSLHIYIVAHIILLVKFKLATRQAINIRIYRFPD